VKAMLGRDGKTVLEERRALAALSEYATVVRSVWGSDDWRSKLYSKKISQWMEDPSRTYKSIARDPRVLLPWLLLAKLPWKRRALSGEKAQEWYAEP